MQEREKIGESITESACRLKTENGKRKTEKPKVASEAKQTGLLRRKELKKIENEKTGKRDMNWKDGRMVAVYEVNY